MALNDSGPTKRSPAKPKPKPEFVCEFCKRGFVTDGKLLVHMCEPKRRHNQRDEKPIVLAFIAYQAFFQRSMRRKTVPTYASFAKSSLYLAFVRFGRHVLDLNAVNPLGYIDFLLRLETKIDKWTSPALYNTYIRELNKNEAPLDALERTFLVMKQWQTDTGNDWRTFFDRIEEPLAALLIANGRISPLVLLTTDTGRGLLKRFNAEQLALIEPCLETRFWTIKMDRHQDGIETIHKVCAEYGI